MPMVVRDTQAVRRVPPQHAFVEKGLYTSYEEARERANDIAYEPDDGYERKFAKLESRAAPAIGKLIAGNPSPRGRRRYGTPSQHVVSRGHCLQGAAH